MQKILENNKDDINILDEKTSNNISKDSIITEQVAELEEEYKDE